MASILQVEQIQGPTSGSNANTITIPSGQTLDASNATLTGIQTPLVAGTDYQTPLVAGTDYQTPNYVLLDSGDNLTATVSNYDFDLDVNNYETHVIYFGGWQSIADGSNLYFDLLYSGGTYAGWYGGNHMVGEGNSGTSNAFSNQAYARPYFDQTTSYINNTYTTGGRIEITKGTRYTMTWQLVGRFSAGQTQHCVGGCVSTTNPSNAVTGFRLSMSQNSNGLRNYRVFGVK